MKKFLKIIGLIVAVVVALFVIAAVALMLFFDPNDYRDDIARYVKDQTGRELKIEGDLSLSYFPWIGIEIGKVELGNASGFGPQPFAQVVQAGIKVQLLPLLRQELVMDKVILDGLQLNLARNDKGVGNWEGLSKPTPEGKTAEPEPNGRPGLARFDISGVAVSDANIEWDDRQAGTHLAVRDLNLATGRLGGSGPVPVKLKFDFLQDPKAPPRHFELNAKVDLDLERGTLAVNDLRGDFAGLIELRAQVQGQGLNDKPNFSGHLELGEFVPRNVLKELGIEPPQTADETVLGKASLGSDFKVTIESLALTGLVVAVDDTRLQGQFAIKNFSTAALEFDLVVDEIDLDRYLPPAQQPPAGKAPAGAGGESPAAPQSKQAQAEPDLIPVETLRGLNLNGTLKVGKLKAYNLRSEQMALTVSAKQGDVRINPASAQLYGGAYNGDTRIDVRGKQPVISVDEKLSGVQAQPLFKDAAASDLISGTADLSAKLDTTGAKLSQIKRGLNGNIAMAFNNGSVKGINIPQMIRKASATLQGQPAPPDEPAQTDFTALTGTATIRNGVVNNQDLNLKSPLLRVDGSGTVDLVQEQIDYTVKAVIVASLEGQGGDTLEKLKGVPIPVHIGGSFDDPKFKVDVTQALTEQQKQRLEKKVDEQKDKLREKAEEQLKGKLPGLGDLLKRK